MAIIDADVIVVGLGPVGAVLSGLLGRRGLRVEAFDRMPDVYPQPRAIVFDQDAMRIVQELGIAARVLPHTGAYRPTEYRGAEGQVIRRFDSPPPPYRLGWDPIRSFNQPAFERELRSLLRELPSVQAHWPADVLSFREEAAQVSVSVKQADGALHTVRAPWLVACDGGASPIRKHLGIAMKDLQFEEHWIVIDAMVNEDKVASLPQTMVQFCDPTRPATFIIGPGRHRRWEIMVLPGEEFSAQLREDELWPLLARWLKPGDARLMRSAAYRFHGLVAEQWRHGRVLLAGDSAHMTPPFIGQGMVQGLRDAQNLAWKLARVIRGKSPASLLDSYMQERKPHVEETTRVAIAMGRVICELDPQRARQRDAAILAEQGGVVRPQLRQSLIPGLQHGLIAPETPGAGQSLPQPRVSGAGLAHRWLDECGEAGIRIVAGPDTRQEELASLATALANEDGQIICLGVQVDPDSMSGRILALHEDEPVLVPWLQGLGMRFVVVRPDQQVYGTASTLSQALALISALTSALTSGH